MSEPRIHYDDFRLTLSDQAIFDFAPYAQFVRSLTEQGGDHQARAIEVVSRYLFSGRYGSLNDLATENWGRNDTLKSAWHNRHDDFMSAQQLGTLLSCSVDHATATGKSYVIFGAAMVALASGQVDRVLVLCPSVTIKEGLVEKFSDLVNGPLPDLLRGDVPFRRPTIVSAYTSAVPLGSICIENIHGAYANSLSAIRDSFRGAGERTLVINDEAHHVYSWSGDDPKEWLNFLTDPDFGFRRVLNLSGTCFINDDYFPDVIDRYSVGQARADKRIKRVNYFEGHSFASDEARWDAARKNHEDNRAAYLGVKPITIFVADTINRAEQLHEDFTRDMARAEGISEKAAGDKTLVVSSAERHKANVATLRTVDRLDNKVEFIFSVSMLTEGWDVKGVLQIVPHDKRAFKSRLLIGQVLGRGLRLLPGGRQASVIVLPHKSWGPEIRRLFDDVAETDDVITSSVVNDSPHHFEILGLEIKREQGRTAATGQAHGRDAGEMLTLMPQRAIDNTGYIVSADDGATIAPKTYSYAEPVEPLDDVLAKIRETERSTVLETGDRSRFERLASARDEIVAELRRVEVPNDMVSATNKVLIGVWLRPETRRTRVSYPVKVERLVVNGTRDMRDQSLGRSELRANATIALLTDNRRAVRIPGHDNRQGELLDDVLRDDLPRHAVFEQHDPLRWRTPVDVVVVRSSPERDFLDLLFTRGPEADVTSWVKSPDSGFYSIPYTIRQDENRTFNPDWILRVGDDMVVVETKEDGDAAPKNKAKMKGATDFLSLVNAKRATERPDEPGTYRFFFLSPCDYKAFFDAMEAGTLGSFVSRLGQLLLS